MSFIEGSTAKFTDREVHLRDAMKLLSVEKDPGEKCQSSNQVLQSPDKDVYERECHQ